MSSSTQVAVLNMHSQLAADENIWCHYGSYFRKFELKYYVLNQEWQFTREFKSYNSPTFLLTFLKWILLGPWTADSNMAERTPQIERLLKSTTQLIAQNIKNYRQTKYHLDKNRLTLYFEIETPLNNWMGLYFYHITRRQNLVNFFSDLNIGIKWSGDGNKAKHCSSKLKTTVFSFLLP